MTFEEARRDFMQAQRALATFVRRHGARGFVVSRDRFSREEVKALEQERDRLLKTFTKCQTIFHQAMHQRAIERQRHGPTFGA